jgi:large subunit ribosomal protein L13
MPLRSYISGKKLEDKKYVRYSGYPGGQKIENYAMLTARRGHAEAIRRAVLGMLPKNRLQAKRIKLAHDREIIWQQNKRRKIY